VANLDATKETNRQSHAIEQVGRDEFRLVTIIPENNRRDSALDHALEETFPASDPVSIIISEVVRVKSVR